MIKIETEEPIAHATFGDSDKVHVGTCVLVQARALLNQFSMKSRKKSLMIDDQAARSKS